MFSFGILSLKCLLNFQMQMLSKVYKSGVQELEQWYHELTGDL